MNKPFRKILSTKVISLLFMTSLTLLSSTSLKAEVEYAKRIIALSPHSVEMLFAIGAGDRIVGTVEYADYPEEALNIPRIGSYTGVQIEQVLALKPDLIIAWQSGNKLTDLKKMRSLSLKLFYSQPKDINQISEELIQLGKLTGLQDNAQKVANTVIKRYQSIKDIYQNKAPVNVFYQLWHDPLRTIGGDSWIDSMVNDCGGQNIFSTVQTPYPIVSLEAVLTKNPEIIIIPHHSGTIGDKTAIWDNWQEITAIKNEHVITINGDILHRFSPRAIDGLEALCQAIDKVRQ